MHDLTSRARSLRLAASILEIVAIICSVGGVMVGAAITSQVRVATATAAKTHPHVAAGNAVLLAAILLGVLSWCVARAIGVFAIDVAARQGVDITERAPSKLPEFLQR
ncbi:MAG: hypothetical protein QOI44_677 [Actinomycetota bacterium]|nr:hypothetical protein [Actinomycetota bacterium]